MCFNFTSQNEDSLEKSTFLPQSMFVQVGSIVVKLQLVTGANNYTYLGFVPFCAAEPFQRANNSQ